MLRQRFWKAGGYVEQRILEDYDLAQRMARCAADARPVWIRRAMVNCRTGGVMILPERAVTSARRWRRWGTIYVTAYNQFVIALYVLGVDPERVARLYYGY